MRQQIDDDKNRLKDLDEKYTAAKLKSTNHGICTLIYLCAKLTICTPSPKPETPNPEAQTRNPKPKT